MCRLEDKVVESAIQFHSNTKIRIDFKDMSYLLIEVFGGQLNVELVEPTLNSDVIPIGTNTLGEGSV